jgi:mono/diheme cytochrome c family protein
MLKKMFQLVAILIAAISLVLPGRAQQKSTTAKKSDDNQQQVIALFQKHCAISGCHQGQHPKKKLSLETDKFLADLVDVPSLQVDSLKRVDTISPEKSYLLMKVKGAKGIVGDRMPDEAPALKPEEIAAIEQWIQSLKAVTPKTGIEKTPEAEKKLKNK